MSSRPFPLHLFALVLLAAGCSTTEPTHHNLTEADRGSTIRVHRGDIISVTLADNPATDYSWSVVPLKEAVLEFTQAPSHDAPATDNAGGPGSGGTTSFQIEAVGRGDATVSILYARPWAQDADPGKTFKVTVEVR